MLVGGALGDRFGIARIFAIGIWIFAAGSIGCALAGDPGLMIAARAVKGIGAALLVPGSMAMVARAYPTEDQGRALGLWAAASTMTTALGPVLGGILITSGGEFGWRLIFALNLPLGLAALWLVRGRATGDHGRHSVKVDLVGGALASLGLGLLAWNLTEPGAGLWLWALAVGLLSGFLIWEVICPAPMIRMGLFRNPLFALTNLVSLTLYFALSGVMFYLPMVAVSAWGISALGVTAAYLPTSVLIAILSAPAGRWADRYGPGPLMAAGSALVALAYAGLALSAGAGDFWGRVVPCMVLAGVGLGLVVAPLTAAVMQGADLSEKGAASGINNAVARVAALIAVALLGRMAAWAYGPEGPGFGAGGDRCRASCRLWRGGFATVTGIAAGMAGMAALFALFTCRIK